MEDDFSITYRNIVKAQNPEEIFGALNAEDDAGKQEELKKRYHLLLKQVHPDHHNKDQKTKHMAEEATEILISLYSTAKKSISTYGQRKPTPAGGEVEVEFNANGYEYKIFSDCLEGDFCNVYFGQRSKEDIENICLKTAKDREDNILLVNESNILKNIHHKSMPILLDSIQLEDGKRANVLRRIERGYDLYELRDYFPNGLPQEHTVWVMDRLLSVLGYIHSNNIIHGAIEPGNIIVTPHNHNGILIDYVFAIPDAHQKTAKYRGVNDYTAPELQPDSRPHPVADMYSLGKTMVYLLGGRDHTLPSGIDSRITSFIHTFLEPNPNERKNDAWKAWHELKDLRTNVFGAASQFLELKIEEEI